MVVETELLTFTPIAEERVRALLAEEENAGLALRVYVAGGGCSGLQYGMALDDSRLDDDLVIDRAGYSVWVDSESARFLAGAEVDYVDGLMGAGFQVNNPNAVSSCGCGHSFRTADESGSAHGCGSGCGNH